jgi:hypothetical protein
MSALPPTAAQEHAFDYVADGPKPEVASLFNHLIGSGEQRLWHCKSDFLRSFEIENKLKLGWLIERNIAGRP